MWYKRWTILVVLSTVCMAGCGGSGGSGGNPEEGGSEAGNQQAAAVKDPAAIVTEFLEAMRSGDDEKTASLLSKDARKMASESQLSVAPQGSDTARFEVGQIEWLADNGARVPCTWTDMDAKGQAQTEEAIWMVRRESAGWRIAGVAYKIFPDEPPLLMNFEDPADMKRKTQWVREEYVRRTRAANSQAQRQEINENSPPR